MSKNKTFEKWKTRLLDTKTPWTENEIIYFRKAIGSSGLPDVTRRKELLDIALEQFESYAYDITSEQSNKGIQWLLNAVYRRNGQRRTTALARSFTPHMLECMREFDHFKFVDVIDLSTNYYDQYFPVYRLYSNTGAFFDYAPYMGGFKLLHEHNPSGYSRLVSGGESC